MVVFEILFYLGLLKILVFDFFSKGKFIKFES